MIASTEDQAAKVREVRSNLPDLRDVIVIDRPQPAEVEESTGHAAGAEVGFADVLERGHHRLMREDGLGRAYKEAAGAISADDVATVIYTSGTTGDPKGVVLTHGAIVSNLTGADALVNLDDADEALSFSRCVTRWSGRLSICICTRVSPLRSRSRSIRWPATDPRAADDDDRSPARVREAAWPNPRGR